MDICIICTDSINTIDTIITKCNHKFHFECINKWLVIKPQCPYCRKDIYDLIHPRTNERIFYLDVQDEYDENYEYGTQYIITPNLSILFLSIHIFTILIYIISFINLTNYIYFYDFCLIQNYNSFIVLVIIQSILKILI